MDSRELKGGGALKRDSISRSEFSQETQRGLELLCEDWKITPFSEVFFPDRWCQLVILLKAAPDNPRHFPKGKWATIQAIEAKLSEWTDGIFK